jgi:hypothetical protein
MTVMHRVSSPSKQQKSTIFSIHKTIKMFNVENGNGKYLPRPFLNVALNNQTLSFIVYFDFWWELPTKNSQMFKVETSSRICIRGWKMI